MNQNLIGLTLLETVKGLEKRSFSLEDLNKAYQVRIAEIDKHSLLSNSKLLNCYIAKWLYDLGTRKWLWKIKIRNSILHYQLSIFHYIYPFSLNNYPLISQYPKILSF